MEQTNKNQQEMTDSQLDDLIMASVQRQKMVKQVNGRVMRSLRWRKYRMYLRMAAVAFGIPAACIAVFLACWSVISMMAKEGIIPIALVIPIITMLVVAHQIFRNISFEKV